eukprot:gene10739-3359_t
MTWLATYLFYFSFFEPIGICMILWNGDLRPSIPTGFLANSPLATDPNVLFLTSIFLAILGLSRYFLSTNIHSKSMYHLTLFTSFCEIVMFVGIPFQQGTLQGSGYITCVWMIMLPVWMLLTYHQHLLTPRQFND